MLIIFSSSFVLLHHHNYIKTICVWHLFTEGLKFHDRTTIPRNFFVEFRSLGPNFQDRNSRDYPGRNLHIAVIIWPGKGRQ